MELICRSASSARRASIEPHSPHCNQHCHQELYYHLWLDLYHHSSKNTLVAPVLLGLLLYQFTYDKTIVSVIIAEWMQW